LRRAIWASGLVLALIAATGCDRGGAAPALPAATQTADAPRQTLQRLIELRGQRRYADMPPLIVPEAGGPVVNTLVALDEFLDANRRLCDWVRDHVGVGVAETIDQSYLGANLGIFSPHVELLDVGIVGDGATASFTADGRLPAKIARLRRIADTWRYDPESGYSEYLPAAFRDMARGLDAVRGELERGTLSADELRDDPERLMTKLKSALRRGVGLLSQARAATEPSRRE
jgi:hypothetical protein